jgi:hypothetical protein
MGRKPVELRLTPENISTALVKGDIIEGAEDLGVVVSARMSYRTGENSQAMIYFMGGDCHREVFGIPQTLTVLRDPAWPEYEAVGRPLGTHVMVEISKTGGGTPGRRYAGTWSYRITQNGKVVAEGEDLRTGAPKTHEEAARIAWGIVDETYSAEGV